MILLLVQSNLTSYSICIEFTENIGVKQHNKVQENNIKLKEVGHKMTLNDFRIPYLNFSMIETIEFDITKIDQTFISDISDSELNQGII